MRKGKHKWVTKGFSCKTPLNFCACCLVEQCNRLLLSLNFFNGAHSMLNMIENVVWFNSRAYSLSKKTAVRINYCINYCMYE